MDILISQLNYLGITQEESQVYINALETNASTVLEYAQNTGIPRTTVYLLVDSLLEKGLLSEVVEGKRKKYIPASPQELVALAKKKESEYHETAKVLEKEVSTLNALYNRSQGKPIIQFKEGIKAVEEVFDDSLESKEICMHFMSEVGREILGDIGERYYEHYMKKMVPTKQIIRKNSKNILYQKEESTSRNKIHLLEETFATETDYLIYNDTVVFFTYKNGAPQLLILTDPQIAFFEKTRFNLLFTSCSDSL